MHDMDPAALLRKFCDVTRNDIVPLTAQGVSNGCKVFGAAILIKSDLSLVHASTNNETVSPLLHGEVNCIQEFFTKLPTEGRPSTKDCIFFATHEPCSLCLSAITWSGFDNFFYMFSYEDTKEVFSIPYDIDILASVFQVPPCQPGQSSDDRPLYNKRNKFWQAKSLADLLEEVKDVETKDRLSKLVDETKAMYKGLSDTYQAGKGNAGIPLA